MGPKATQRLYDLTEVAKACNVTKSRMWYLKGIGGLPTPAFMLRNKYLYTEAQVEAIKNTLKESGEYADNAEVRGVPEQNEKPQE